MKCVIDEFIWRSRNDKSFDPGSLQELIHLYINAQGELQTVSNPCGDLFTGGLGEPKFHVDKTAFTEVWGRPQRDGPALRAIVLAEYSKWLFVSSKLVTLFPSVNLISNVPCIQDHGARDVAKAVLWPIIRNDLSYVSKHWNETGFGMP